MEADVGFCGVENVSIPRKVRDKEERHSVMAQDLSLPSRDTKNTRETSVLAVHVPTFFVSDLARAKDVVLVTESGQLSNATAHLECFFSWVNLSFSFPVTLDTIMHCCAVS